MQGKITQLTKDGVKTLMEKNYKGSYFQIIEMNNMPTRTNISTANPDKTTEKFKVSISDGFSKVKTFFASDACKAITSGLAKNFSVFEILSAVINISDKTMIIIVKINVILENVPSVVGNPIEFDEYKKNGYQNPSGSIQIPSAAFTKKESDHEFGLQSESFASKPGLGTNRNYNQNPGNNSNSFSNNFNSNQPQPKSFSLINKFQNNQNNFSMGHNFKTNQNNFKEENYEDEEDDANLMTIAMLNPICSPDWRLKARILKKNDIKQYKNAKGEGSFFTIEIMDKNLTEIGCSFFNSASDKWFDFLVEGNMYIFSGGIIKENNSRYNTKNDYQISFDERANIQAVKEDKSILRQKFSFVKLNQISELPLGTFIDLIAIVKDPGNCQQITLKSGELKNKRSLMVFDENLIAVEISLWGDLAARDFEIDKIVIFKQLKVSEFNSTRNLSSGYSCQIIQDCEDIPEYKNLIAWQRKNGTEEINISLPSKGSNFSGKFKAIAKLEEEASLKLIDANDKIYSDVKAFVVFIRNSENATLFYLSCPAEKCMRKVVEESDGWRCEKCMKSYAEPLARYILSAKISDDSGSLWVSIYDPIATSFIGKSANEVKILKDQGQYEIINNIFRNMQCIEVRLKLLSKMEIYNGETKVKHQILRIHPAEFSQENKTYLGQIEGFIKKMK